MASSKWALISCTQQYLSVLIVQCGRELVHTSWFNYLLFCSCFARQSSDLHKLQKGISSSCNLDNTIHLCGSLCVLLSDIGGIFRDEDDKIRALSPAIIIACFFLLLLHSFLVHPLPTLFFIFIAARHFSCLVNQFSCLKLRLKISSNDFHKTQTSSFRVSFLFFLILTENVITSLPQENKHFDRILR